MSAPGNLQRKHALFNKEYVALESTALVLCADHVNDPRDADFPRPGNSRPNKNNVIELQELVSLDRYPPVERCRTFGAEHHADAFALTGRSVALLRHRPPRVLLQPPALQELHRR